MSVAEVHTQAVAGFPWQHTVIFDDAVDRSAVAWSVEVTDAAGANLVDISTSLLGNVLSLSLTAEQVSAIARPVNRWSLATPTSPIFHGEFRVVGL